MAVPPSSLPGWERDPSGRADYRYWDGSRWTDRVSRMGREETDRVHFKSRSEGPRSWSRSKITVFAVLAVIGVAVAVAADAEREPVQDPVEPITIPTVGHVLDDSTISRGEYEAIPIGTGRANVIATLGDPAWIDTYYVSDGCYFYSSVNDPATYFWFCFNGEVVEVKGLPGTLEPYVSSTPDPAAP